MIDNSKFDDEILKDKLDTILNEDDYIKKWNEGLFIKSLILFPILIFIVGIFIVNRPEKLIDILLVFLYPIALILAGLLILFVMRSNLN